MPPILNVGTGKYSLGNCAWCLARATHAYLTTSYTSFCYRKSLFLGSLCVSSTFVIMFATFLCNYSLLFGSFLCTIPFPIVLCFPNVSSPCFCSSFLIENTNRLHVSRTQKCLLVPTMISLSKKKKHLQNLLLRESLIGCTVVLKIIVGDIFII